MTESESRIWDPAHVHAAEHGCAASEAQWRDFIAQGAAGKCPLFAMGFARVTCEACRVSVVEAVVEEVG